ILPEMISQDVFLQHLSVLIQEAVLDWLGPVFAVQNLAKPRAFIRRRQYDALPIECSSQVRSNPDYKDALPMLRQERLGIDNPIGQVVAKFVPQRSDYYCEGPPAIMRCQVLDVF